MNARTQGFKDVRVHGSLRSAHQSALRRAALESGAMDGAFHYQSVRQSELWMDVHRRHAPVAVDPAFREIFERAAGCLADAVAGRDVHVLGLGPGGGEKEAQMLRGLREAGCRVWYTPVDVSVELAIASAHAGQPFAEEPVVPVAADLRSLDVREVALLFEKNVPMRLVTAFGLLPNFRPEEIFPLLSGMLRPGDLLAVSANLAPAAPGTAAFGSGAESVPGGKAWAAAYEEACLRVLPQYDNPETHRWLRQVLVEWGLDPLLDGTRFGLEWIGEVLGLCARCAWKIPGPLDWEGTVLAIDASRALRLFFSLRYTPAIVTRKLHAHGFRVEHGFQTPCSQEGVWVATRRA